MKILLLLFFVLTAFSLKAFPMFGRREVQHTNESNRNLVLSHEQSRRQIMRENSNEASAKERRGNFSSLSEQEYFNEDMDFIDPSPQSPPPASTGAYTETDVLLNNQAAAQGRLGGVNLQQAPLSGTSTEIINPNHPSPSSSLTTVIHQVAPPGVRAEEVIQKLQQEVQIAQEMAKAIRCLPFRSAMSFLRIINVNNTSHTVPGYEAFWAANRIQEASSWSNKKILLNNGSPPAKLFISETEGITPPIILQDAKTSIVEQGETKLYQAPARTPTAEENKKVRTLVRDAFKAYYGHIDDREIQNAIDSITSEENLETPMILLDVAAIFSILPDMGEESSEQGENQEVVAKAKLDTLLGSPFKEDLAAHNVDMLEQSVREPQRYLATSLSHSAEGIRRVAVFSAAGAAVGAAVGATMGTILPPAAIPFYQLQALVGSIQFPIQAALSYFSRDGSIGPGLLNYLFSEEELNSMAYFYPGPCFQKAREALMTLSQNEEKAREVLELLKNSEATHAQAKTTIEAFFNDLVQKLESKKSYVTSSSASASAFSEEPISTMGTNKIEENIKIVKNAKGIIMEDINSHIREAQDLSQRLERAIQWRDMQKKADATWKGTNFGYYRRPGV